MRRALIMALAGAATALVAGPAYAVPGIPATPGNDPCSYTWVVGGIACQGYYGGNYFQGSANTPTPQELKDVISLLLNGTAATNDTTPTSNGPAYNPPYALNYDTVLDKIDGLNGASSLTFSPLLSGLTIVGVHFGNTPDSDPTNPNVKSTDVSAFWLVNVTDPTHTLRLTNGQGSSNAEIFSTSGAVPEPATWAMMLVGFGGIGMTMRARRKEGKLLQVA